MDAGVAGKAKGGGSGVDERERVGEEHKELGGAAHQVHRSTKRKRIPVGGGESGAGFQRGKG